MAKKKFGLSSTLNKNKTEEPTLPQKVPLNKTQKNLNEVKEKVEALHDLKAKEESTVDIIVETVEDIIKPEPIEQKVEATERVEEKPKQKPTRKTAAKKVSEPKKPERMVRITVDTPKSMHMKLKIKAIEHDITIRDYVINLISKDLGFK